MSIQYPIYCARAIGVKSAKTGIDTAQSEKEKDNSQIQSQFVSKRKKKINGRTAQGSALPKPFVAKQGEMILDSDDIYIYEERPMMTLMYPNLNATNADKLEYCPNTGLLLRYNNRDVCPYEISGNLKRSTLSCEAAVDTADVAVWWNLQDRFLIVSYMGTGSKYCTFYMLFFLRDLTFIGLAKQFQYIVECIAVRWVCNEYRTFPRKATYDQKREYTNGINFGHTPPRLPCNIRWIVWSGERFYKAQKFGDGSPTDGFYLFEQSFVPEVSGVEYFSEEISTNAILHDVLNDEYLLVVNGHRDHFSFKRIDKSDISLVLNNVNTAEAHLYACNTGEAVSYEGRFFFFTQRAFETNVSIPQSFSILRQSQIVYINPSITNSVIPMEFAPVNACVTPSASVPCLSGIVLSSKDHDLVQFDVVRECLKRAHRAKTNISLDVWKGLYYTHPSLRDVIFIDCDKNAAFYLGVETSLTKLNLNLATGVLDSLLSSNLENRAHLDLSIVCSAMYSAFMCRELFVTKLSSDYRGIGGSCSPLSWIKQLCSEDTYNLALVDYNIHLAGNGSPKPIVDLYTLQTSLELLDFLSPLTYYKVKPSVITMFSDAQVLTVDLLYCFLEFVVANGCILSCCVLNDRPLVGWFVNPGESANVGLDRWLSVEGSTAIITHECKGVVSYEPKEISERRVFGYFSLYGKDDVDLSRYGYTYPSQLDNAIDFSFSKGFRLQFGEPPGVGYTEEVTVLTVPLNFLDWHFEKYGSLGSPSLLHVSAAHYLEKCGLTVQIHPTCYGQILRPDELARLDFENSTDSEFVADDESDYD